MEVPLIDRRLCLCVLSILDVLDAVIMGRELASFGTGSRLVSQLSAGCAPFDQTWMILGCE